MNIMPISHIRIMGMLQLHHLNSNKANEEKARWEQLNMLRAVLNKSWKQHSTKQQMYGHSHKPVDTSKIY